MHCHMGDYRFYLPALTEPATSIDLAQEIAVSFPLPGWGAHSHREGWADVRPDDTRSALPKHILMEL